MLALVADLMFATRIQDTLGRAGYQIEVEESAQQALVRLSQVPARVLIVDIAAAGSALGELVGEARARGVPVVAFGPHVEREALAAALAAGCAEALPRSRFASEMAAVVARHFPSDQPA